MISLIDRYGNNVPEGRAELISQCMQRLKDLEPRERELILCWFCPFCGKYIAPGEARCRCVDER